MNFGKWQTNGKDHGCWSATSMQSHAKQKRKVAFCTHHLMNWLLSSGSSSSEPDSARCLPFQSSLVAGQAQSRLKLCGLISLPGRRTLGELDGDIGVAPHRPTDSWLVVLNTVSRALVFWLEEIIQLVGCFGIIKELPNSVNAVAHCSLYVVP